MAITGSTRTLFEDTSKTKAIFPRTKTSAITNADNENLDNILAELRSASIITLGTTWTAPSTTGNCYTQQVTFASATANDHPILDVVITDNNVETIQSIQAEWGKILKAVTNDGSITFYASEPTTRALTIQAKGVGVYLDESALEAEFTRLLGV